MWIPCFEAICKCSYFILGCVCSARTLLTGMIQITARPVDSFQLHLAQVKALQRWLEHVTCASKDKLCGLLFHAVTKTYAPIAKAGWVKATKTWPSASSVMDMWSDGSLFTDVGNITATILKYSQSQTKEKNGCLLLQHVGVVTRVWMLQAFTWFWQKVFDIRHFLESFTEIGISSAYLWSCTFLNFRSMF